MKNNDNDSRNNNHNNNNDKNDNNNNNNVQSSSNTPIVADKGVMKSFFNLRSNLSSATKSRDVTANNSQKENKDKTVKDALEEKMTKDETNESVEKVENDERGDIVSNTKKSKVRINENDNSRENKNDMIIDYEGDRRNLLSPQTTLAASSNLPSLLSRIMVVGSNRPSVGGSLVGSNRPSRSVDGSVGVSGGGSEEEMDGKNRYCCQCITGADFVFLCFLFILLVVYL